MPSFHILECHEGYSIFDSSIPPTYLLEDFAPGFSINPIKYLGLAVILRFYVGFDVHVILYVQI